ncbi:protein SDA1 homolog isoform X2 [Mangifera indica]|uniref:protein SDA1 homolog isoform X2 n=1 Tax=Mangifera indica TaxID=29780 RepID=UPI001CFBA248|nr:protein SDA1 homolog isoform X2 [Mangifera indica]
MSTQHVIDGLTPESLSASGRSSEKLSLPILQSKMKCDPDGYETELTLIYKQFNSALDLFQQQAALNFGSISGVGGDHTIAKDLGDRAMFLAHVTPFYRKQLADFPSQLAEFLKSSAATLPSGLRCHVTQALILLVNRKIVDTQDILALFMELQTLGDRNLRKLAFSHVVHSIKRMNQKHKNEPKNRALQNIVFSILQAEDETRAKRALTTLCELHRRKVWFDDRTANAICKACFHSSSRIMIAALSFLLDYEDIEDDDDSDASSDEDDVTTHTPQAILSKEAVYKAHHKGTTSSKKKKKAKLQRAMRSMKKQQRLSSEKNSTSYYSPLNHLIDAQGFAEKLFSRLQTCNERFEPHQRDITNLLAAAVQACHDMVPPDAVEPLFKQIVNQFVHDRSRTEAIAVGLNVVREICLRMPLLMTEDLLQDLVLYKKSHEKAVSAAARSLVTLFREVCPSLLVKKDRGRPVDPKARPRAYGEVSVASDVPGVELLQHDEDSDGSGDDTDESTFGGSDDNHDNYGKTTVDIDEESQLHSDGTGNEEDDGEGDDTVDEDDDDGNVGDEDDGISVSDDDDNSDNEDEDVETEEDEELEEGNGVPKNYDNDAGNSGLVSKESKARKRKYSDFDEQLIASDTSLRALKKLAEAKIGHASSDSADGILSNEDFQRIKELKAKKDAKLALAQQGFKVPSSDQLSVKRVDPAKLEAHVRQKLSKEERLALVRAGREDRGKFMARTAVKQKKTGGLSNRQKEHKKAMPLAAKRAKAAKSREEKKKKHNRSGKQFRGRKAWK